MLNTALGRHATLAMGARRPIDPPFIETHRFKTIMAVIPLRPIDAAFIDTHHDKTMAMIKDAFGDHFASTLRSSSDRFFLVVDGEAQVYAEAIGDGQDVVDEMRTYNNSEVSKGDYLRVAVLTNRATKATIYAAVNRATA
jgi:hypothetical protein